jgi:hypothetical protein
MYLQEEIEDSLWAIRKELLNTETAAEQINLLAPILGEFGVKFRKGSRPYKNWSLIGFYDPNRDDILIVLGNKDTKKPNPFRSEAHCSLFLFELNTTVQHELIHKYQWLCRDPSTHASRVYKVNSKRQRYYGDYDEIETQAHDLAMEMKFYYPDLGVNDIIRDYHYGDINLPTLNNYMKAFKGDTSHPVMKRMFKKLFNWLPKVQVKRPITYSWEDA